MNTKLIRHFMSHRAVTLELLSIMRNDDPDFKPSESSMSIAKLAVHMATSMYKFTAVAKAGSSEPLMEKEDVSEPDPLKAVKLYTEKTVQLLESLTDDDLSREIDLTNVFGFKTTGASLVKMGIEHEVNHKGNLFVYARLLGHTELPLYVKKG
ncbi:DinB family protein [Bacillus sp. FSL H8-0547]